MRKFSLFMALAMILGHANPANANPIARILDSINNEIHKALSFVNKLDKDLEKYEEATNINIENVAGELGIVDLTKTEENIATQLEAVQDLAQYESLITFIEADTITNHADSILGTEGQDIQAQAQQAADDALQTVAALEQQATGAQTSQEVLKALAGQQAKNAALSRNVLQSIDTLKQTTALNNRASATRIRQEQQKALQEQKARVGIRNHELAALELLNNNLVSKPCPAGENFIVQDNLIKSAASGLKGVSGASKFMKGR